jgi:predicted membrane channel-forming protein YqfA (hemolysin III family)
MRLLLLSFLFIFLLELLELKMKKRKKRTYFIVFLVMGTSFLYCLLSIVFKHAPSPNDLIQFLFQPLQKKLMG